MACTKGINLPDMPKGIQYMNIEYLTILDFLPNLFLVLKAPLTREGLFEHFGNEA